MAHVSSSASVRCTKLTQSFVYYCAQQCLHASGLYDITLVCQTGIPGNISCLLWFLGVFRGTQRYSIEVLKGCRGEWLRIVTFRHDCWTTLRNFSLAPLQKRWTGYKVFHCFGLVLEYWATLANIVWKVTKKGPHLHKNEIKERADYETELAANSILFYSKPLHWLAWQHRRITYINAAVMHCRYYKSSAFTVEGNRLRAC